MQILAGKYTKKPTPGRRWVNSDWNSPLLERIQQKHGSANLRNFKDTSNHLEKKEAEEGFKPPTTRVQNSHSTN